VDSVFALANAISQRKMAKVLHHTILAVHALATLLRLRFFSENAENIGNLFDYYDEIIKYVDARKGKKQVSLHTRCVQKVLRILVYFHNYSFFHQF